MGDVVQCDAVDLLKAQHDNSIPLIVADPPYGIGYHSNHYKGRNPHSPIANDWDFKIEPFLEQVSRVLIDGGAFYLFCRYDVLPLWVPFIPAYELKLKTVIAWVKDNWSAGDLNGSFGNQYEQIMFVTKGRHILRGKRWSNVWNFARVASKSLLHPAQKPVEMLERIIVASSDENDPVIDPFCGSGSTGVAAANTKRDFLLGDMDIGMVNVARKRLGLPVEEEAKEVGRQPILELQDVEDWGLPPDELRFLYDEMKKTVVCNEKGLK